MTFRVKQYVRRLNISMQYRLAPIMALLECEKQLAKKSPDKVFLEPLPVVWYVVVMYVSRS